MAGLGAAYALRSASVDVVLFEKSRGVSGRATTRRRHGARYDHGANYFKTPTDRLRRIVCEELPTDDLVDIAKPIWTFDAEGTLEPGDPERDDAPKWTYRTGIHQLGKHLHQACGATLHTEVRIEALARADDRWSLRDTDGHVHDGFDAVLLTPPAPQVDALLSASALPDLPVLPLRSAVQQAAYQSQFTVILCFEEPIARPDNYYALINTDREHAIAWLSFEDDKPGHVPAGQSVLIAQMAPGWTEAQYDEERSRVAERGEAAVRALLPQVLPPLAWADIQRWRYALPTASMEIAALADVGAYGLFVAGDSVAGSGRVHVALQQGLDVAGPIGDYLARVDDVPARAPSP